MLTHAHDDHLGGAAEMITAAGLKGAAMHAADAAFVRAGALPRAIDRQPRGEFSLGYQIGTMRRLR